MTLDSESFGHLVNAEPRSDELWPNRGKVTPNGYRPSDRSPTNPADGHGHENIKAMMLRVSIAAALLLGGSITAAFAASDIAPAAAETSVQTVADTVEPRFEPSEAELTEAFDAFEGVTDTAEAIAEDLGSGVASWYGAKFAGNKTASGERFDPSEYTAAHRTLPFGSRVKVSRGDRSVIVRINDRGPFHGNRVIDLSRAAASDLGLVNAGSGQVKLALLD